MFLTAILILEVSYRTNPFDLSPLKKNPAKSPTRYIRNTLGNVFTKWGVGGWEGLTIDCHDYKEVVTYLYIISDYSFS